MKTPSAKIRGKTDAASKPDFSSPPKAVATELTMEGPIEQPISPANASSANMAVPPLTQYLAERLKVPGHMRPTEIPQKPQPMREMIGMGENTATI